GRRNATTASFRRDRYVYRIEGSLIAGRGHAGSSMTSIARITLATLGLIGVHASVSFPVAAQKSCTSGTGVIHGTVRDDSTGAAVDGSWVALIWPDCTTRADAAGRFRFERLPPGSIQIDAGHSGYRQFSRVVATVTAGQTTEVVLRLRAGGPVEDCRV